MRIAEAAIAGCVLAVLALGMALLPLLTPAFTAALSARYSDLPEAGIVAEAAREFVVSGTASSEAVLAQSMGADEIAHLRDVGTVIVGARWATLGLALGLAVWIAANSLRGRPDAVRRGLRTGGWLTLALLACAGLAGTVDFETLFMRFHGLFFAEGTWMFPYDSALIRLFPEQFWVTSGAAWAALSAAIGATYLAIGRVLRGMRMSRPFGR